MYKVIMPKTVPFCSTEYPPGDSPSNALKNIIRMRLLIMWFVTFRPGLIYFLGGSNLFLPEPCESRGTYCASPKIRGIITSLIWLAGWGDDLNDNASQYEMMLCNLASHVRRCTQPSSLLPPHIVLVHLTSPNTTSPVG